LAWSIMEDLTLYKWNPEYGEISFMKILQILRTTTTNIGLQNLILYG